MLQTPFIIAHEWISQNNCRANIWVQNQWVKLKLHLCFLPRKLKIHTNEKRLLWQSSSEAPFVCEFGFVMASDSHYPSQVGHGRLTSRLFGTWTLCALSKSEIFHIIHNPCYGLTWRHMRKQQAAVGETGPDWWRAGSADPALASHWSRAGHVGKRSRTVGEGRRTSFSLVVSQVAIK